MSHEEMDKQCEQITATRQAKSRVRDLAWSLRAEQQADFEFEAQTRRAGVCRDASAILYISSGACAAFGTFALRMGNALLSLGAMALAGVAAAVGYWCDKWSRR